ncbi:CBS domain-containing protein [Athalassotoga saccharophila]|uniref:CBS domain-containing protein n=1 Tax=Athalassotoga saccharophila TaxID=1441386 RepID=UPI001379733F|nr:CBS domain-containing protein [Athalassotoga saccharophila]BBJ27955.1 carnitine transport ATP-binding protein OpuCA [Athalassotoga saccharophila]
MESVDDLIRKIQPYFSELSVGDLMSSPVVTVREDQRINEAKELLRTRRISGLPVIDDGGRLKGIISIEDIIHALENNMLNSNVSEIMTKNVVCLTKDEKIMDAFKKFEMYGYGRFPVVDENKNVIGIVTKYDLMIALLAKLSVLYVHDARREQFVGVEIYRSIPKNVKIVREEFEFQIDYKDISMAGTGASELKKFLISKNFPPKFVKRVAIATYEAETNVVIHSNSTGRIKAYIEPEFVEVRVNDNGKGIENIDLAMKEGFSTAPDYVREYGFGAGMGLANMKRCADRMVILSSKGNGVFVEMHFWRHEDEN